jgi:phosphate transport system protein
MKPLEGHISRAFDGALGALHLHVVAMGSLAVDQVRTATRAYIQWDAGAARVVLEREQAMNAYDNALDEEQLALLARRQPLASDLRFVIAFSRAVAELERVGDEAKKIARIVITDPGPVIGPAAADIADLGQRAENLLRRAMQAFDTLDEMLATEIVAADKDIDALYDRAMTRLLEAAAPDAAKFRRAVHAAFILKSMERIGDHARNIARLLHD